MESLEPNIISYIYPNELVNVHDSCIKLPNKKESGVLILFKGDTEENTLPENERLFLSNILKAVNLSLEEVVLINWNTVLPNNWFNIQEQLEIKCTFSFGLRFQELGLNYAKLYYQLLDLPQGKLLAANSLKLIEEDLAKKKQLWIALKQAFSI